MFQLKKLGAESKLIAQKQAKPSGFVHSKEDLGNQSKWTFGDMDVFTKLVKGLEEDIAELYEFKKFLEKPMCEIESNLLKGINSALLLCDYILMASQLKPAEKK